MSIRIPIYEQQTQASGPSLPRVPAPQVGAYPIGGAMANIGKGLDSIGDAMAQEQARQNRVLKQQEEEDARAYAGRALSDAHVQWGESLQQRQEQAAPGAPGFTPGVLKDYDEWSAKALEQAPTDAAKKYLGQHLVSYRTQLAQHALAFESQARVGWRVDEFSKSVDNWAVTVAKDPSKYDLAVSALSETLPAVGPIQQEKLREYMRKSLAQGVVTGQIQSNPEAAYTLLSLSTLPAEASEARDKTGTLGAPVAGSGNRGIRNNNPGNIVKSEIAWQGKVAGQDPRFETFETPEAGIRALGKNLVAYQDKHGRNTVSSIISAWAPASENNTGAYIANVSKALGVAPDAPINVKDPAVMKKLAGAIITQENGSQPYSEAQMNAGLGAALGVADLPPAVPKADTGTEPLQPGAGAEARKVGVPWLDALTLQERLHYIQAADAEVRRRQQVARADLELKERDQNAQALAGKAPAAPLQLADYVKAYGQVDGPRRYGEFSDNQQFGANVQQVALLTPAEQAALLGRNKPVDNTPGFANDQKRYELLAQAVAQSNKQRLEDPLGFAAAHKLATLNPINWADPASIAKEMPARAVLAGQNSGRWGAGYQVLTDGEADQLGTYLSSLQAPDKARVLGQLYQAGGPAAVRSIAGQLKDKHETLAIAGALASRETTAGRSVAQLYLEGKEALAQKRAKIDEKAETGLKANIFTALDGVYLTPQARDAAADTAYAIYAKFKSEGKDDWEQAVRIATGGLTDYNGSKIAKPYGWDDARFKDWIAKQAPAQIAARATADFGRRQDGTAKGNGFLGVLRRPDGNVSTEISIGVNIGGKEMDIPTLVPTLTQDEVKHLLANGEPTRSIVQKAVDHAKARLAAGRSVFAGLDESPAFIAGNQRISATDLAKSLPGAKLQTYGDGSYLIRAGSDFVRLPDGRPFVLQVGP